MDWRHLRLGRDEHAFICGLTGSGKSELTQWIVRDRFKKNSIVYDPKHSPTITRWQGQTYIYSWSELVRSRERRIVYRPSKKLYWKDGKLISEAKDLDRIEEFFAFIYGRGYTRLVIDESAALPGGTNPSQYLELCITQGRELGISCVCLTQRPSRIPLIMMSEARRIYFFRLNMEEDMLRLAKITGISIERQRALREFQFYMHDYRYGAYPIPIKLNLSRIPSPLLDGGAYASSSGARA